eukprot:scaffold1958_cov35-Phaeocystis_antarctica.AAC.2
MLNPAGATSSLGGVGAQREAHRENGGDGGTGHELHGVVGLWEPGWSTAVEWATLEAASSSTRGSGGALSGPASFWECRAAYRAAARPEEAQEPSWGTAKGAL